MKKIIFAAAGVILGLTFGFAQNPDNPKPKFILMVSEQNIEGPQRNWWASEIDLSVTESTIAQALITEGYEVLEPSVLDKTISRDPAFRVVNLAEQDSVKLGKLAAADYVVLGKAIATSGGNVPQSSMRSCFANITAKVIKISDGKVLAYLDASGNSAHLDVVTGGKEALKSAGADLASKIIGALAKKEETK